jgi:hypothetical protein
LFERRPPDAPRSDPRTTTVAPWLAERPAFHDEFFTEKLATKAGWNRPTVDADWFRGFPQEIGDFVSAIRDNRAPRSGIDPAVKFHPLLGGQQCVRARTVQRDPSGFPG